MSSFKNFLVELSACSDAKQWVNDKTWLESFSSCERGDWMLWLYKKTMKNDEESLRRLTLAKAECAKTVLHLMKDQRSKTAIEIAIKFGNGEATREELDAAAYAAAYAAYAAADADADAADDAYAAAYAAYARKKNQQETADICRRILPIEAWNIPADL